VPLRRAIEVDPHTVIVALFDLASTFKYKAKPGRALASRSQAATAAASPARSQTANRHPGHARPRRLPRPPARPLRPW